MEGEDPVRSGRKGSGYRKVFQDAPITEQARSDANRRKDPRDSHTGQQGCDQGAFAKDRQAAFLDIASRYE